MDRTSSRWLFYLRFYSMLKISKSACTTTVRTIHLISSLGSSYELQCWSFVVEEYLPRLGLLFRHHQYFKNWIMEWEFKTRLLGLLFLPPYCLSFSYSDGVAIVVGSGIGGTEAASSKSGGNDLALCLVPYIYDLQVCQQCHWCGCWCTGCVQKVYIKSIDHHRLNIYVRSLSFDLFALLPFNMVEKSNKSHDILQMASEVWTFRGITNLL